MESEVNRASRHQGDFPRDIEQCGHFSVHVLIFLQIGTRTAAPPLSEIATEEVCP